MKLKNEIKHLKIFAASYSGDSETQVGAKIIDRETRRYSMAANDHIFGTRDLILPNTRPNKYRYIIHAEINAISLMNRGGLSTEDNIVIITHSPCVNCMLAMWQAGIDTIYFETYRPETDLINDRLDLKANLKKLKNGYYKLKLSLRS